MQTTEFPYLKSLLDEMRADGLDSKMIRTNFGAYCVGSPYKSFIDKEIKEAYRIFLNVYNNLVVSNDFRGDDFSSDSFIRVLSVIQEFNEKSLSYLSVWIIRCKLIDLYRTSVRRSNKIICYQDYLDSGYQDISDLPEEIEERAFWEIKAEELKNLIGEEEYATLLNLSDIIKNKEQSSEYRKLLYKTKKKLGIKS